MEEIKKTAEDAATAANTAQTTAITAQETATAAQSTAETANTTASEAKTTAEAANTTAESANTTALSAQSTAESAQNTANTANSTANTAKEAADSASTTANTANSTANTAKTTAEAANTNANEAKETANTANTTASAAQSTANAASTAASNAQTTADNAQSTAETAQTIANTAKEATDTLNTLIRETTDGVEVAKIDSAGAYTGMRTEQTADAYLIKDKDGNELASYGANTIKIGENSASAKINMCDGNVQISTVEESMGDGSLPINVGDIQFVDGYGKVRSCDANTGNIALLETIATAVNQEALLWVCDYTDNQKSAGLDVGISGGESGIGMNADNLHLSYYGAQGQGFAMSDVIKALNNGLQLSTKSFQHTFGVNSGTTYGAGSWTSFTTTNINVPADKLASDDNFLVTLSVGINGKADGAATVRWWATTQGGEYVAQTTRQTIPLKSGITSTFNVTFNWWPGHTPVAFLGWPQVYATAQWSPSFAKVSISRFANNFQSA